MTLSAIRAAYVMSSRRTGAPPPPVPNPNFANVKLLLNNGNGTEGNQDMTDMSLDSRVVTWISDSVMDTGIEKFLGAPTLLLDGTFAGIRFASSFPTLAAQNFVIETWVRPATGQPNATQSLLRKWATTGKRAFSLHRNASDQLVFIASSDGTTTSLAITSTAVLPDNAWHWVVMQREGNDFTQWIDGTRDAPPTADSLSIHGGDGEQLRVGFDNANAMEMKGNFGPIRITVGEAIYLGAPATIPIPFETHPAS